MEGIIMLSMEGKAIGMLMRSHVLHAVSLCLHHGRGRGHSKVFISILYM